MPKSPNPTSRRPERPTIRSRSVRDPVVRRQLSLWLPEDIVTATKIYAIEHDMAMRDVVTEALAQLVGVKSSGSRVRHPKPRNGNSAAEPTT